MRRRRRTVIGVVVLVLLNLGGLAALAGCSDKQQEPFRDAGRGATNDDKADFGSMPDGFSNWSTKCDHGNRIYVVFHGDGNYGAITAVPKDPTCPQPPGGG